MGFQAYLGFTCNLCDVNVKCTKEIIQEERMSRRPPNYLNRRIG